MPMPLSTWTTKSPTLRSRRSERNALVAERRRSGARGTGARAGREQDPALGAAQLVGAGHGIGFKVHVGGDLRRRALGDAYAGRATILADLLSDTEKMVSLGRYLRGPAEVLDAVDVVWYDAGRMVFLWQLDWTARLHRSLVTLGDSIPDDPKVFRNAARGAGRRDVCAHTHTRAAAVYEDGRRLGWRCVKCGTLRAFAIDPAASLEGLEPVLGLEPAVEQAGQQLAFKW